MKHPALAMAVDAMMKAMNDINGEADLLKDMGYSEDPVGNSVIDQLSAMARKMDEHLSVLKVSK